MGTFHIDFILPTLYNTDRIETNDLHNSTWNGLTPDIGGYTEVFQLVVQKTDIIFMCLIVEVVQSLRHRYVVVTARNLLRLCVDETAQDNQY